MLGGKHTVKEKIPPKQRVGAGVERREKNVTYQMEMRWVGRGRYTV